MVISIEGVNGSGKSYMLDKLAEIFNNNSDEIGLYRDRFSTSFHETKPTQDVLSSSNNFLEQDNEGSVNKDIALARLYLDTYSVVTDKIKSRKNLDFSFLNRWTLTNYIYTISKYEDIEDQNKIKDFLYPIYKNESSEFNKKILIPDLIIYVDCDIEEAIKRGMSRNANTGKVTSKWEKDETIQRLIKKNYDDYISFISNEKKKEETIFDRGNVFYKSMVIVAENFGTKEDFDLEIETIAKSLVDARNKEIKGE